MNSQHSVALLGLSGFAVTDAAEIDGEMHVGVETDGTIPVGCPACGVVPALAALKERNCVKVRDLPIAGRPTVVVWNKRRWRCREAACDRKSFTETHPDLRSRRVLTERARAEICRLVGKDAVATAKAARDFGVGWHTAWDAVKAYGYRLIDDPARTATVHALGVDETAWLTATRAHHTMFISGMVCLSTGRLLDVVPDRNTKAVADWLSTRTPAWLAGIGIVALDPHRGYANAMAAKVGHATMVVDHFHVSRLGNNAVDDARRRTQQAITGHRGRKADPLYRIRKLLTMAADRLDVGGWARLARYLHDGDPDGHVAAAWQAKECLRTVYRHCDIYWGRQAIEVFYHHAHANRHVPEVAKLARFVRQWESEILAWHTTSGASNARCEATNLAIKAVKRVGRGFTNFENNRLRLLLHAGTDWHTHTTARLRTRRAPLSAA